VTAIVEETVTVTIATATEIKIGTVTGITVTKTVENLEVARTVMTDRGAETDPLRGGVAAGVETHLPTDDAVNVQHPQGQADVAVSRTTPIASIPWTAGTRAEIAAVPEICPKRTSSSKSTVM